MALVATAVVVAKSGTANSYSAGPVKCEHFTYAIASADTSGTITAKTLTSVTHCEITGVTQTALPTYSGNVVTVAFVDPAATRYGQIRLYGV